MTGASAEWSLLLVSHQQQCKIRCTECSVLYRNAATNDLNKIWVEVFPMYLSTACHFVSRKSCDEIMAVNMNAADLCSRETLRLKLFRECACKYVSTITHCL